MQTHVFKTAQQVGEAAATLIAAQLLRKPDSILGLATGSSPIPTYEALIRMYRQGVLDFSRATSFNLDEYVGLPADHPCSYHHFMQEHLFSHINIRPENVHIPDGGAADLQAAAHAYDAAILAAGGIDLQLLGIGRNGHIGFNEPGEHFVYGCHKVRLSESTIRANKRFFFSEADVPRYAVSLGIGCCCLPRALRKQRPSAGRWRAMYRPCGRRRSCARIPTPSSSLTRLLLPG